MKEIVPFVDDLRRFLYIETDTMLVFRFKRGTLPDVYSEWNNLKKYFSNIEIEHDLSVDYDEVRCIKATDQTWFD